MKILVVSQYYYPEQFRINDICEELARRGHKVTVLTGLPNYPEGEIYQGYNKIDEKEECNGVHIIRCKIKPRRRGNAHLFLNYISFEREASKKVRKLQNDYDVIYAYQLSPITSMLPAIKYKKKTGLPIFLYCCDLWPDSVRDVGVKPMSIYNPVYIISKYISKYVYGESDKIGVKCKQFIDYFDQMFSYDKDKYVLIYEHAEKNYLSISDIPENNGCYDFMYLGNIGKSQNCDCIVKAAMKIKTNKSFKIHFVGSGSELDNLRRYVIDNRMNEIVKFHKHRPVSEINQFYEWADCCMVTLSSKTVVGNTLPAKLTSYMAASRPVIAAAEGAIRDIIEDADCGVCTNDEDIDALAEAMEYAINNQKMFQEKGKKGRIYFNKYFTLEKHVDDLETELVRLVDK